MGRYQLIIRYKILVTLTLSIFLAACCAQSQGYAQNVGGDYGRTWLNNFNTQNPKPVAANGNSNGNDLWNWGSAPKGSIAVNGKLVSDPYYFWKSLNYTSGWLGLVYVDPKTNYPIYGFLDPNTGSPVYFFVDPNTGRPVFTNSGTYAIYPYYGGISPYYSSNFGTPASAYYPWLGAPTLPYSSIPSYDYLGRGLGYF
jgi:hypothetical protein